MDVDAEEPLCDQAGRRAGDESRARVARELEARARSGSDRDKISRIAQHREALTIPAAKRAEEHSGKKVGRSAIDIWVVRVIQTPLRSAIALTTTSATTVHGSPPRS